MSRTCKYCGEKLSDAIHGSATYCSEYCYYESKKDRSRERYRKLSEGFSLKEKNEKILSNYHLLIKKEIAVTAEMLEASGFDWGYSNGEIADGENNIWKVIGNYRYHINKDKTIKIWTKESSAP